MEDRLSSQAPAAGWLGSHWWLPVQPAAPSACRERMCFHARMRMFYSSILTNLISENAHDH